MVTRYIKLLLEKMGRRGRGRRELKFRERRIASRFRRKNKLNFYLKGHVL